MPRREFLAGGLSVALSPLVPARLARVLQVGGPLALLAHFGLPTPVRVWSRSGTLRYGGFDWQGVGALGRISSPAQNTQIGIKQVTFELRGVPPTSDDFLAEPIVNAQAQVWLAAIRKGQVYGETFLLLEALLERAELAVTENRGATIQLTGSLGLWSPERAVNKAWTDESQKDLHPDDTGFSLMPSFTTKDVRWRVA